MGSKGGSKSHRRRSVKQKRAYIGNTMDCLGGKKRNKGSKLFEKVIDQILKGKDMATTEQYKTEKISCNAT